MSYKKPWSSKITEVRKNSLVTRGISQEEMIESFSYEDMVFLLIVGRRPSSIEANILRAVIVAYCSHGITGQSTMAVRMAVDCGSNFQNAAFAGFAVGSGRHHQGALQDSMNLLLDAGAADKLSDFIDEHLAQKHALSGYGHRFHPQDPRARKLVTIAESTIGIGKFLKLSLDIESILNKKNGRFMNLGAAAAGLLLDLGFSPDIAFLIPLVGRSPMYAAAFLERAQEMNPPFQRIEVSDIVPGRPPEISIPTSTK